jgi:hypothetical protein
MGLSGFDGDENGNHTCGQSKNVLKYLQNINGKNQSDRIAEGEAILASIFSSVAVAA